MADPAWFNEPDWLIHEPILGLTWVRGLDEKGVLAALGADPASATVVTVTQGEELYGNAMVEGEVIVVPMAYVGRPGEDSRDGWLVVVEPNSLWGRLVLEALSADGRQAVALVRTETIDYFRYAVDGVVKVSIEPGERPADRTLLAEMTEVGMFDRDNNPWRTGLMLRMIGEIFGVATDRSTLFNTPFLAASVPAEGW